MLYFDNLLDMFPIQDFFTPGLTYELNNFEGVAFSAFSFFVFLCIAVLFLKQFLSIPNIKHEGKYEKYIKGETKGFFSFLDLHIIHKLKCDKFKTYLVLMFPLIFLLISIAILYVTPYSIEVRDEKEAVLKYMLGKKEKIRIENFKEWTVKPTIKEHTTRKFRKSVDRVYKKSIKGCELRIYQDSKTSISYFINNDVCMRIIGEYPDVIKQYEEILKEIEIFNEKNKKHAPIFF